MKTEFSMLADIDATELFENENVNWKYCVEHATFHHKGACEFILHIGSEPEGMELSLNRIAEMWAFGCTEGFIQAYAKARDAGAIRVLLYA